MKGDVATISPDHPDAKIGHLLLMKALGTTEWDFIDGLLAQLANAATKGRAVDDRGLQFFMLAVVKGIRAEAPPPPPPPPPPKKKKKKKKKKNPKIFF